ncbi:MAG TPA: RHS repeat-associated core domain-containing protein, partial [Nitrosomonas sp.]|nr:RHS repeat-associated core domain-containing protein [Nitrosomonas sp.]
FTLKGNSGTIGDAYKLDAASQLTGTKYGASNASENYSGVNNASSMESWTYDAGGNRLTSESTATINYAANDINQYTTVGAIHPEYTDRGDLANYGDWQYAHDAFGHLIRAHNIQNNLLAKYTYDAFGRRVAKDVNGAKTLFFNQGALQLEAYDISSASSESIIYEPGIDRPIAKVTNSGALVFFHQDWLGSVVLLTDHAGTTLQRFKYDSWGKVQGYDAANNQISESTYAARFLFTAREFDAETGLYHYRARTYSPELGRFTEFDPIGFSGGDYNLARYVSNNTVNLTDPLGTRIRTAGDPKNFGDNYEEITWETPEERKKIEEGDREMLEAAEKVPIEIAVDLAVPGPENVLADAIVDQILDPIKDAITDLIHDLIDPLLHPPNDPQSNSGGE